MKAKHCINDQNQPISKSAVVTEFSLELLNVIYKMYTPTQLLFVTYHILGEHIF